MDDRTSRQATVTHETATKEEFAQLLEAPVERTSVAAQRIDGMRVGKVVGFANDSQTPLVIYPGQPATAAFAARATVDLHGAHIGREVALLFENSDPCCPVVVGCLQNASPVAAGGLRGQVEVDADGRRLVLSADDQIVLRCGKASITLTKEGKLILQGAYVSHHSSGVLRLKGGSVQIN